MPDYVLPAQNLLGVGNVNDHALALTGTIEALGLTTAGAALETLTAPAPMPVRRASEFPWWVVVVVIGAIVLLRD